MLKDCLLAFQLFLVLVDQDQVFVFHVFELVFKATQFSFFFFQSLGGCLSFALQLLTLVSLLVQVGLQGGLSSP